jgi:hypothetical protein
LGSEVKCFEKRYVVRETVAGYLKRGELLLPYKAAVKHFFADLRAGFSGVMRRGFAVPSHVQRPAGGRGAVEDARVLYCLFVRL